MIDLQSRTKVYWEGEESPRDRGWLDPGQFIQVGPYRIRQNVAMPVRVGTAYYLPSWIAGTGAKRSRSVAPGRARVADPDKRIPIALDGGRGVRHGGQLR